MSRRAGLATPSSSSRGPCRGIVAGEALSRRSSLGSVASSCSSLASTPCASAVSASRSTCASVSSPVLARDSSASLLSRAGLARLQLGGGGGDRPPSATAAAAGLDATRLEASEVCRRAVASYGARCPDGTVKMASQGFSSLCNDCGIVDERLASHVNLIFARTTRPAFQMDAQQLASALELVSKRSGRSLPELYEAVGRCAGNAFTDFPGADAGMDLARRCQLAVAPRPVMPDASLEALEVTAGAGVATLDSIFDALSDGDVVLLRGRWLLELFKLGSTLPHRQDLPAKASWPLETLRKLLLPVREGRSESAKVVLAAVSCFWLAAEHPDPRGQHLQALCHYIGKRLDPKRQSAEDVAVFWDYACSPQEDQSLSQRLQLERALERRSLWYTHPKVEVWILTEDSPGVSTCVKSCAS
eukprot:TRINITY_DN74924_c0_g1_i1.p1 TRINITY_DN74924_c0_g1~~TRINITY_DN74924_c0_g1_i1.p1  ORF type:complete len:417 (+),score=75.42 TRINITY_DN74924_c0_g1_i1:122-1372(+)